MTLAWCFADERTPEAAEVLGRVAENGARVPSVWHLEVANGLSVAQRRGRITSDYRAQSLRDLTRLTILVDAQTNFRAWESTLDLADRFQLTIYDAAYLEVAQRWELPLATLDGALRQAAGKLNISLLG